VRVSVTVDRVRHALSSVESAALAGVAAALLLSLSTYPLRRQPGVGRHGFDHAFSLDHLATVCG